MACYQKVSPAMACYQKAITTMVILLFCLPFGHANEGNLAEIFKAWAVQHQKVYLTVVDYQQRFENFKKNWEYVEEFNKVGNKSYTVGLNQFADLSWQELEEGTACVTDPRN